MFETKNKRAIKQDGRIVYTDGTEADWKKIKIGKEKVEYSL